MPDESNLPEYAVRNRTHWTYSYVPVAWAQRWPAEETRRARKR